MWHSFSDTELNFNPDISLQFRSPTGQTKTKVMCWTNIRSFVGYNNHNVIHCLKYYTVVNHKLQLLCPFIYEPWTKRTQQGPLFERSLSWVLPFGCSVIFHCEKKRTLCWLAKVIEYCIFFLLEKRLCCSEFKWSYYKLYVSVNDQ